MYMSIAEAAKWASNYTGRVVSVSNVSYLVQYGRISSKGEGGTVLVSQEELMRYYETYRNNRVSEWKNKLGDDLNWNLSFDNLRESDTTKHVHRLHPYKGKYIPQLVEYFLDSHTDNFKQKVYFQPGDTILDPFAGSGTTLVQANELGMNAIGIDVSEFNALIGNCKVSKYDFFDLQREINRITEILKIYISGTNIIEFEESLLKKLADFNGVYFPVPQFKYDVRHKLIDGNKYGEEKAAMFLPIYEKLVAEYGVQLLQSSSNSFLEKWYSQHIRNEIDCVLEQIKQIQNPSTKKILTIILSRTMRSCGATTHADLATLVDPVSTTYYCAKHGKICKPLFSILKWWESYSKDTLKRLIEFHKLRTDTFQYCIAGDSRKVDIFEEIEKRNPLFGQQIKESRINGIFSSPPYVGLIDYHEQHAYAYDLFGFSRHDDLEIGPLSKGQTLTAKQAYVEGIAAVLNNCKAYLVDDYNIFLVANDKYNLYPQIAEKVGMQIVKQFKRPVLNRSEKDKGAYAEIIFHLKRK